MSPQVIFTKYSQHLWQPSPYALLLLLLIGCHFFGKATAESPPTHTINPKRFAAVTAKVKKLIDKRKISGAVVLIEHRGKTVYLQAQGQRDIQQQSPMQRDTIFRIYSMTKPVTTVAAMMLYEKKFIKLDDPIEKYLPEFKNIKVYQRNKPTQPKHKPTIRQLMTHTAGLSYGYFSNTAVDKMYNKSHPLSSRNNQQMVNKLAKHPLLFEPGDKWHYSLATDVLGHLIEKVSKQPLDEYFQQHIFTPLGMNDTAFYVPKKKLHRFASSYTAKLKLHEAYHSSKFSNPNRLRSGGGGLVSTAQDYLQFCQMLLHQGSHNGKQLLQRNTIQQMTRNQLPKGVKAYKIFGFGLGFLIHLYDWGKVSHRGEYSWSGAASTHFWISPRDDLIVIALSQRQPFSNELKKQIRPLIYNAIQ